MTGQHPRPQPPGSRIIPALIVGAGSAWALHAAGPLMSHGSVNPLPALAAFGVGVSAAALLSDLFRIMADLANTCRWKKATGFKGSSGFAAYKDIQHELESGWGPYWGAVKHKGRNRELIFEFESNALTVSPAGTKKDVGVVQPTAFAIRESKTIVDAKGTTACCIAEYLAKRGEKVHILNLGDTWGDILGESATYNPLCWLVDNFWNPASGILDVEGDAHEFAMQLLPEPQKSNGGTDNSFFRDGSRDLIAFAIQACVLRSGRDATLGDVAALLSDRSALVQDARWLADRLVIEELEDDEVQS